MKAAAPVKRPPSWLLTQRNRACCLLYWAGQALVRGAADTDADAVAEAHGAALVAHAGADAVTRELALRDFELDARRPRLFRVRARVKVRLGLGLV